MGTLKRTRDGVDAVEHALSGVHTSENSERIVSFRRQPGFIGHRSLVQVDVVDDQTLEREVIVRLPPRPRQRSR
jgi:hypothetical protein